MTIARAEGISHETIYQGVYANGRRGLAPGLGRHLHRRRSRRKRRRGPGEAKKASPLGAFRSIASRPKEVEERETIGDFEGDLVIGAAGRSAVITLVDRATDFCMLGALPARHGADAVLERLDKLCERIHLDVPVTITWDQGREMARWAELEERCGVTVYFADPHSPWQRPVNENFNGLLRRWLPKGTDLSVYSQRDLDRLAHQINAMPRRSLGWESAAQHWYDALVAMTT